MNLMDSYNNTHSSDNLAKSLDSEKRMKKRKNENELEKIDSIGRNLIYKPKKDEDARSDILTPWNQVKFSEPTHKASFNKS